MDNIYPIFLKCFIYDILLAFIGIFAALILFFIKTETLCKSLRGQITPSRKFVMKLLIQRFIPISIVLLAILSNHNLIQDLIYKDFGYGEGMLTNYRTSNRNFLYTYISIDKKSYMLPKELSNSIELKLSTKYSLIYAQRTGIVVEFHPVN